MANLIMNLSFVFNQILPEFIPTLSGRNHPRKNNSRKVILSELTESIISEGLFKWFENRDYRATDDSIEKLAGSLGVSAEEIAQYLYSNLDIKYHILKTMLRIQDASLLLLLYPNEPIGRIGDLLGYSDTKLFLKHFKSYTRHRPVSWHRKISARREAPRPTRDERRPVTPILKHWCPFYCNY